MPMIEFHKIYENSIIINSNIVNGPIIPHQSRTDHLRYGTCLRTKLKMGTENQYAFVYRKWAILRKGNRILKTIKSTTDKLNRKISK